MNAPEFLTQCTTAARSSAKRLTKFETWAYGLVGGTIGGGATSVTSWLGMVAAKSIGIDVPTLNLKSLGVIFISGAATSFFAYLSKSPLPPISTGNSDPALFKREDFPIQPTPATAQPKDP